MGHATGVALLVSLGMTIISHPQAALAKPGHSKAKQAQPGQANSKQVKAKKPGQTPGGANQVDGLRGTLGQMLFDGKWRFQVQDVQEVTSYVLTVPSSEQDYGKYHDAAELDSTTHTFTPKAGNMLVIIRCLVKNAQHTIQQLDEYLNDPKTALTDDQGNSYPPIAFDMVSKGAWITKPLLPGSGESLSVVFAVPTGIKPKDLLFTLKNWSEHAGHDVRVSLTR